MSDYKRSKIYTKTGDKGTSSLYNGERRNKDDLVFEALGAIDELNAALGVAREYCTIQDNGIDSYINEIQSRLFDVGSSIATPRTNSPAIKLAKTSFDEENVTTLEKWIDTIDANLPPLKNFILPSGGLASSHLHVARTICRRAERRVVSLSRAEEEVEESICKYLNRLSDFLFVAARLSSMKEGKPESIWKKYEVK